MGERKVLLRGKEFPVGEVTGGFAVRLVGRRMTRERGRRERDCREKSRKDELNCGSLKSQHLHRIHTTNVCSYFTVPPIIRSMEN